MNDQKTILQPLSALLGKTSAMEHIGCLCKPKCPTRLVQLVVHRKSAGRARIHPWGGDN